MLNRFLEAIGGFVLRRCAELGRMVLLYMETMRQLFHRPRYKQILYQMSHLGVDSPLIVSLTLAFTDASSVPCSWPSSVRAAWVRPSRPKSPR